MRACVRALVRACLHACRRTCVPHSYLDYDQTDYKLGMCIPDSAHRKIAFQHLGGHGQAAAQCRSCTAHSRAAGYLEYECARVRWFLSIDINDVPAPAREQGQRTFRSITVNGQEIEFSGGFTDLHTRSYEEILAGRGFGLEENRVATDTVATIRSAKVKGGTERHPYLAKLRK